MTVIHGMLNLQIMIDLDVEDKVWTCLALVTRSLRGKMMKMPRRRAIAMLMITWYMRMMTPLSGTNF